MSPLVDVTNPISYDLSNLDQLVTPNGPYQQIDEITGQEITREITQYGPDLNQIRVYVLKFLKDCELHPQIQPKGQESTLSDIIPQIGESGIESLEVDLFDQEQTREYHARARLGTLKTAITSMERLTNNPHLSSPDTFITLVLIACVCKQIIDRALLDSENSLLIKLHDKLDELFIPKDSLVRNGSDMHQMISASPFGEHFALRCIADPKFRESLREFGIDSLDKFISAIGDEEILQKLIKC
jgi:hypothetical protein